MWLIGAVLNFALAAIILFILFKIVELVISMFGGVPPQAIQILKLVCALILVLWLFDIVGVGHFGFPVVVHYP